MKKSSGVIILKITLFVSISLLAGSGIADSASISAESQECIDCHSEFHPGIVNDWLSSRHSNTTPEDALAKPELERRVSSESIPEALKANAVGCFECHSLNAEAHTDNFEHFGYDINVIVSPYDCQTCHAKEVEQYLPSKKANALDNLRSNPVYHTLVETIASVKSFDDEKIIQNLSSENIKNETCYACHGTEVKVIGKITVESALGEIEVPKLSNWPNQGVGRINPDGSMGACSSCHPRHSFSIEIARKPATCYQCHLEPDLPAWNVYKESKHGNIYSTLGEKWHWDNVPWRPGLDFKAPTCAACHNSLLVNNGGDIIAERSHNFGDRLWVRIFGLIYSHPQPIDGKTYLIKNDDGLPLPTTFAGKPASEFLLNAGQQQEHRNKMIAVCHSCHGTNWTNSYLAKFDRTIAETDSMVAVSTQLMQLAWEKKIADPQNPFDERIEQVWIKQWLFYANSVRYASAMMGPDYAAFKNGWWELTHNLKKLEELMKK